MKKIKRLVYISAEEDEMLIEMWKKGYISSSEKETLSDLISKAIRMLYASTRK